MQATQYTMIYSGGFHLNRVDLLRFHVASPAWSVTTVTIIEKIGEYRKDEASIERGRCASDADQ